MKIAKATGSLQIEGHKAIARVIKHTDSDSPVARTVIIQNSPEAHKAFGVRNVPKNILRKFSQSSQKPHTVENTKDQRMDFKENGMIVKPPKIVVLSSSATDILRGKQESTLNSKKLQSSTTIAKTVPTTTQLTEKFETQTPVRTGTKQQRREKPNNTKNIPRRIRSYSTGKNAGNIISKHVIDTNEKQHETHEVTGKHAQNDNRNNNDKSVAIHVLKNPNTEKKMKVDKAHTLSSKPLPMIGRPKSLVNQLTLLKTSPVRNKLKSYKINENKYGKNIKYQKKRHIESTRKSKFNPPSKFFYGFQPIELPRYHQHRVAGYFSRN